LCFTFVGFLATGSTRSHTFRSATNEKCGLILCVVQLALSYFLLIVWMLILGCVAVVISVNSSVTQMCKEASSAASKTCVDFSFLKPFFQILSDYMIPPDMPSEDWNVCDSSFYRFCAVSMTSLMWYWIALGSALSVILGVLHFIICATSNYSHVRNDMKYAKLREILMTEDIDVNIEELRQMSEFREPRNNSHPRLSNR
ncbi:hypothetical protein AB6A40_011228, partial [Gnathostoma spinigerum]